MHRDFVARRGADYHYERNALLRKASVMEELEILPCSVFVRREPVEHTGSEWREGHCAWYHTYLIPENHDLPDNIAF